MTKILDGLRPKKTPEHHRVDEKFVDGPGIHRPGIVFVISVALIGLFTLWAWLMRAISAKSSGLAPYLQENSEVRFSFWLVV